MNPLKLSRGTLSVARFKASPADGQSSLRAALSNILGIRRYSFQTINDDRGERCSNGWINPRNIVQCQVANGDELLDRPWFYLGVRVDRKLPDPTILRARIAQRTEDLCRSKKLARLTRQQRIVVQEEVAIELLRETSPRTTVIEVAINIDDGTTLVFHPSPKTIDSVVDLLRATFDLTFDRHSFAAGSDNTTDLDPDFRSLTEFLHSLLWDPSTSGTFPSGTGVPPVNRKSSSASSVPSADVCSIVDVSLLDSLNYTHADGVIKRVSIASHEDLDPASDILAAPYNAGMDISSARLAITEGEDTYEFTLRPDRAACGILTGVRLPVPPMPNPDETARLRIEALLHLYDLLDQAIASAVPVARASRS